MSVITIFGQVGAGDHFVAKKVAENLGYHLVDRPLIEEVLKQYGIVDYEQLLDTPSRLFDGLADDKRNANDLLNSLYLLFAQRGNVVILSRRAFISLEPFINVFTVFLKAAKSERIKYIMREMSMDARAAEEYIAKEEEKSRGIVESIYNRKWDSMKPWTLIVDTHKLGLEKVITMITDANSKIAEADGYFGWEDGIPTTDTIETDPIMEKAVDALMAYK